MTKKLAAAHDYSDAVLRRLRSFLVDRIQTSSERVVAMKSELSRSTLSQFVHGKTKPRARTMRLLTAYYLREMRVDEQDVGPRRAAIGILFPGVPEVEIVAVLEEVYTAHGIALPHWLARIRELAA